MRDDALSATLTAYPIPWIARAPATGNAARCAAT